jgi:hypothetical protein
MTVTPVSIGWTLVAGADLEEKGKDKKGKVSWGRFV